MLPGSSFSFLCRACGAASPLDQPIWRCPRCDGLLDVVSTVYFDPEAVEPECPGLWRYRRSLPIASDANIVTLGEGWTPLLPWVIDGREVWLKQEQLFPTGSYKDRGATVLISAARERGVASVVEDSSGNAGSAIAAYCARAGIDCRILAPADTSPAKLAQIRAYGAELIAVPGNREATAAAAWELARTAYYASHVWNPFFIQGTKTFAYEVCEQLGWRAPDAVVLPVGNGTLLLGAAIGFDDLLRSGVIAHIPRLIGVQSAACAPLAAAQAGEAFDPLQAAATLAAGIAIAAPARGEQILEAVSSSGGTIVTVREAAIRDALRLLVRQGLFVEPTAAATIAGLRQVLGELTGQTVVSALTGHGLKAAAKVAKVIGESAACN